MVRIDKILMCLIFSSTCFAGGNLAKLPLDVNDEVEDETIRLEVSVIKNNTAAAKFCASSVYNIIETNLVTYETAEAGVYCHVAWYPDGCVISVLNGPEVGKQIIIVNGSVVGISYDIQVNHDHFIHSYIWGEVYSYSDRQAILVH